MSDVNTYSKNMLRSMEELKQGNWVPGFSLYEFREYSPIKIPLGAKTPLSRAPFWQPGLDVKGCHIVVTNEQGMGDNIMYSRFIPMLKQLPIKSVSISMNRGLAPLIGTLQGIDEVLVDENCRVPAVKVKCLSLPALLLQYGLLPSKQPSKVYLSEGYLLQKGIRKTKKVGFCWRSENSSWNAEAKKIPQDLAEKFYKDLTNSVDVVSLQIQPDFMPSYLTGKDWLDTAKKLQALDAIVSVDTAVAHLGGALGVRTLNLIGAQQYAGWFYFPANSERTAWYDSMELIWYEPYTDWKSGLDQALEKLCR